MHSVKDSLFNVYVFDRVNLSILWIMTDGRVKEGKHIGSEADVNKGQATLLESNINNQPVPLLISELRLEPHMLPLSVQFRVIAKDDYRFGTILLLLKNYLSGDF
jgi:hypothetical protein